MKRVLSILLSVTILFSICTVFAQAKSNVQIAENLSELEYDGDPVVYLLGYSSANLYYNDGVSGSRERIWNLTADGVVDILLSNIPKTVWGLFKAVFFHRYNTLNDVAGIIAKPVLDKMEKLTMLPDGTSKYDLSVYPGLSEMPFSYSINHPNVYVGCVSKAVKNSGNNVYVFIGDWRYGQLELAKQLDAYIQQVKAYTGKDHVTLFGFSQGGQTIATYLYEYGYKHDVRKAVMDTPAIGGTTFAAAILDEKLCSIRTDTLISFAESYSESEMHLESLGKLLNINFLRKSILSIAHAHVVPIGRFWGSLWDLIPVQYYDALKEEYLDPVDSAKIIRESDYYHYEIVPNIGQKLRDLQQEGIQISIVCNTSSPLLFASTVQGDGILETGNVSGAATCPMGKTYSVSYKPQNTVCKDSSHQHISPNMTIDASTAYLPENTWFVDGQYHGQCDWDSYTNELLVRLTLTDDITNIYSDERFPQFTFAQSPADTLFVSFNGADSFVSGDSLTIRNLSGSKNVKILNVKIQNTALKVDLNKNTILKPSESISLRITGTAPDKTVKTPIKVTYINTDDKIPMIRTKVFETSFRV